MEIDIQPNESVVVSCFNGKVEERLVIKADENGMLNATKEVKGIGSMTLGWRWVIGLMIMKRKVWKI